MYKRQQQQHDCGPGATYTRDPAACARIPPPPTHDPALTADAVRAKLDALRWKGRGRRVPAGTALAGMYVDARSKTIFCPIFKNAHTAFTHYFHRLRDGSGTVSRRGQTNGWFNRARGCSRGDVAERWGTPQYNATRAYCNAYYDTWLPERPYAKRLGDYTTREAANMLADPAWLKAVVVRDPLERAFSHWRFGRKLVAHSARARCAVRRVLFRQETSPSSPVSRVTPIMSTVSAACCRVSAALRRMPPGHMDPAGPIPALR